MSQFRQKHFRRGLPALFSAGMELAIWLRAGIGAIGRITKPAPAPPQTPATPVSTPNLAAPLRTLLIGDPTTIQYLQTHPRFTTTRTLVTEPSLAEELILCEGPAFSFRECIKTLESTASGRSGIRVKFYAKGGGSVVGSAHRDGRGEILLL